MPLAGGLALLLALGAVAASCSGPSATTPEPERPQQTYRIQVHTTPDQAEAEQVAEQVRTWWQQLPEDGRPAPLTATGLDPEVVWQQPYYRVRIGRFASRAEAAPALDAVRARFGNAFLVPERLPAARR